MQSMGNLEQTYSRLNMCLTDPSHVGLDQGALEAPHDLESLVPLGAPDAPHVWTDHVVYPESREL
jgi:hypothetical protein